MSPAKNRAGAATPSRPGTASARPGLAVSETTAGPDKPEDKPEADPGGPDDTPYIVTPTGDRVPLAQYLAEGR